MEEALEKQEEIAKLLRLSKCEKKAKRGIRAVRQRQFQVTFSKRGMLNLLHRIKLSYTRPTYSLAKADPEKQEKFREELESIKKTSK